jgi:signal transduction histidine kinase
VQFTASRLKGNPIPAAVLPTLFNQRIRDLFAGVLTHDLRSPLGAISNATEVVLHDSGLSPSSVKAVAIAQRGPCA